jgi:pyrimidine operon attenuation protein/uracil phosphoribosyltransferase
VRLAVLVDRGGRELPVQADFAAARVAAAGESLALARNDGGSFVFRSRGLIVLTSATPNSTRTAS